jgi:hypothetical protein
MTTHSYRFDHTPSTNSSGTVYAPPLAGLLLLTGLLLAPIPNESTAPHGNIRDAVPQLNGTFSQLQNAFTGAYTSRTDVDIEGTIAEFYATLVGQQEPLGAEFDKILYDNLWDLYDG